MGIRQTLNENPAITAAFTIGIIVVALIFIIVNALPKHQGAGKPGKAFYTDDDGASTFIDSATKIPPFDHNGKQAVLAYVYKCGKSGEKFVAYMQEYTPQGQQRMQQAMSQPNSRMMEGPEAFGDILVKKRGDANWISRTDNGDAYNKAVTPTCPDGGTEIYQVDPNVAQ